MRNDRATLASEDELGPGLADKACAIGKRSRFIPVLLVEHPICVFVRHIPNRATDPLWLREKCEADHHEKRQAMSPMLRDKPQEKSSISLQKRRGPTLRECHG